MNTVAGHISFNEVDETTVEKNQAFSYKDRNPESQWSG